MTAAITLSFQSHNGAIAADIGEITCIFLIKFQSHNGAIAARVYLWRLMLTISFNPTMVRLLLFQGVQQFLSLTRFNPTMVRLLLKPWRPMAASPSSFQSHNGAIAAEGKHDDTVFALLVSIPQWCDCCRVSVTSAIRIGGSFNPTMVRLLPERGDRRQCCLNS